MHVSRSFSADAQPFSVQDARDRVAGWIDLSNTRRRDLDSTLVTLARNAGLPPGSLLLTPDVLRERVLHRSAAADGVAQGTKYTARSNLRFILRRLGVIDAADLPLNPDWEAQLALLGKFNKAGLIAFARFCSAQGIAPETVSVPALIAFEAHLEARTMTTRPSKRAGEVRGEWNRACTRVTGWVGQPLGLRKPAGQYILPLPAFSESFQVDLAAFGQRLGATSLHAFDVPDVEEDERPLTRAAALRPSSVALRLSHARWAASALVGSGVPVAEITSLASLVVPLERARAAVRFLYDRAGGKPSAAGMHVAEVLRIIAKHHVELSIKEVAKIKDWGKPVALSYRGMTDKNERAVCEIMQPHRLENLLALPEVLMRTARLLRTSSPGRARSRALQAVAIGILLRLPLRLANVAGLQITTHLHRPDPKRGPITHVRIPPELTKNKRQINLPVSKATARLIQEWIDDYRAPPVAGCDYLFPTMGMGTGDKAIGHQGLRDAIKGAVKAYVGPDLSPHQFRHLAARLFLDTFPGHYEAVRQLLGHASIATTTRHYSGIESEVITKLHDEEVLEPRGRKGPGRGHAGSGQPKGTRPGKR